MAKELQLGMDKPATTTAPAVETAAAPETAAAEAQPAAETAKEKPQGQEAEATATTAETVEPASAPKAEEEPKRIPYSALKEEREKRKRESEERRRLEAELAYLKGKVDASGKQEPKQPTREEIEQAFFTDPTGFVGKQVQQAIAAVKHDQVTERAYRSEIEAKQKWKDWDDVFGEFHAIAGKNPQVIDEVYAKAAQGEDPAAYIYNSIKMGRAMRETGGSVEQLRQRLESEIRAEMEAKYKKAEAVSTAAAIPKTRAGVPGTGALGTAPTRDTSKWDKLFANKRF